jgi:osmotically-inducible protein OsmY
MGSNLLWRTDSYLRDAVQYQLERELDVNPLDVGITASDGAVTLTGFVQTFAEKLAAERAARRVEGVKAVANEIQVTPELQRTDAEIEHDAVRALRTQTYLPADVRVAVSGGFLRLEGTGAREFQRKAAEAVVKYLKGVTGVANGITVVRGYHVAQHAFGVTNQRSRPSGRSSRSPGP